MSAGRQKRLNLARGLVEQTKKAIRREGYNRGVRAAAKVARQSSVFEGPKAAEYILKLLKPRISNPNFSIQGR